MLFIVGVGISFFLSLILFTKRGNTQADRILACWMLGIGVHLLSYFFKCTEAGLQQFAPFLGIEAPFPMIHGPFLLLYTLALTQPKRLQSWQFLLAFSPLAAVYAYLFSFISASAAYKLEVYQNDGRGYEHVSQFLFCLYLCLSVAYGGGVVYILNRYREKGRPDSVPNNTLSLRWLNSLNGGLAGIALLSTFGFQGILYGCVVLFVLYMGYYSINRLGLFTAPQMALATANGEAVEATDVFLRKKYARSGLSESAADQLYSRLLGVLEKEDLYIEPELNLQTLSDRLGVHPNYLSQVINEKEGMNFYDFINARRIEAFKKMLQNPKNDDYTLLALAFQCGFNSKSAFNRQFKKATGLTPSQYHKQVRDHC